MKNYVLELIKKISLFEKKSNNELTTMSNFNNLQFDIAASTLDASIDHLREHHLSLFWGDKLLTLDKTAGFLSEPKFSAAFKSIYDNHKYDQYNGPDRIAWRLNTLCWAARCASKIPGSFVECGTFKGDMAWVILQVIGSENISNFYLYDSFDGFSLDLSSSEDYPLNEGFFTFANNCYQEKGIYESVVSRFKNYDNVKIIKGFVPNSFKNVMPEKISFLHIDLNSPKAEIAALEHLFDLVVPGGVIIFDDYGWKVFESQKIVEDLFMQERGYEILELPTGQGLVFKR